MKLLAVVTSPPAIYHSCSTCKTFREDDFTPVNTKSCGRRNVRKHSDIKNGEKYIILDISFKLDLMDKREVTSSESKDYMVVPDKGLTNSQYLSNTIFNKKQRARFSITDIINQELRNLLKKFRNSPGIGLQK